MSHASTNQQPVMSALRTADLSRLGFRPVDARETSHVIDSLATNPGRLETVCEMAEVVRTNIGNLFEPRIPFTDDVGPTYFEDGLVMMLALLAVAEDAHAGYLRQGVPSDVAWRSLSDLGQQVHVFRNVFGFTGLAAKAWCTANFTGRHLWLGRLQFTLERSTEDPDDHHLGVHIPETGPLTPESIDESLVWARRITDSAYGDFQPSRVTLDSWLLDPGVTGTLNPESNLVKFTERFDLDGGYKPRTRDHLFYGFHLEPRLQVPDLGALPRETSLQRAILHQVVHGAAGCYSGVLRDWPSET